MKLSFFLVPFFVILIFLGSHINLDAQECQDQLNPPSEYISSVCDTISSLPWSDNFNSYGAGTSVFPICWYRNTTELYSPYVTYTSTYGNGSLYFSVLSLGDYNIAAAPILSTQIPVQTVQVSFKYKTTHSTDSLIVGVMTDPANESTFHQVAVITNSDTQLWYEKRVLFNQYPGTGCYIALKVRNNGVSTVGNVDDFVIDYVPPCLYPINLQTSNASTSTVDLSWTEVGNASSWNIRYAPVGSSSGDELWVYDVTSNPFQINGLNPQSAYCFYVQSVCGDSTSPWSLPAEAVTSCSVISQFPYFESFDSYFPYGINYPTCWTKLNNGDNRPIITMSHASPPASISFYCSSPGKYNYAILPPVADSIPIQSLRLEFKMQNLQLDDTLYVGVMTSPTDTATFTLIESFSVPLINQFQDYGVNFSSYTGNGKYIALKATYGISFPSIQVDDVKLFPIPACARPTGLEVPVVTENGAQLYWIDDNSVPSWNVEYGPMGFIPGTGIELNQVTNTPITISGLNPNSTYQFYVYANCDSVTTSLPSIPFSFTTACTPLTTLPYYENFDTYGVGNGLFPSCWRLISQDVLTYSNHLSSTHYSTPASMHIYSDDIYSYKYVISPMFHDSIMLNTLQLHFKMMAGALDDTLYVGIMNSSTDPFSFELIQKITSNNVGVWEDQEVFLNTYSGIGKMIAFKTTFSVNSSHFYIDDLVVDTMPHCPRPSQLTGTSVTSHSIVLGFTENGTSTSWVIEYGPTGFIPGTGTGTVLTNITHNPILISGLTFNTTYQFYVKSLCGVGEESLWSNPLTVTTSCYQISTLPWVEDFNNYGIGPTIFPTCWVKKSNVANNPYISTGYYNNVGVLTFTCTQTGYYNIACTPEIDSNIPINTLQAHFRMKVLGIDDTLYVGIMTDPTMESTFECVDTVVLVSFNGWFDQEISFSNYSGMGQYIAFKTKYGTTSSTVYIDDLIISFLPTCPVPTQLEVSNIAHHSVQLQWTENGGAENWKVEFGPAAFILGTGSQVLTDTHAIVISGLSDTTWYDFYVQAVCSATDSSIWSVKERFCTAQTPAIIPLEIDFETPSGFQFANNLSGNKWYIGTTYNQLANNTLGGANGLFISEYGQSYHYNTAIPSVVWAYRDVYFTPSSDDYLFNFDWKLNGEEDPNDYLSVYIGPSFMPTPSTNGTVTVPKGSDTLVAFLRQQTTFQTQSIILPLGQYSGQTKRIYFMWRNNNDNGSQPPAAVDNISITTLGETECGTPTNLTVSSITYHSVLLNWTPGGAETEWIVEYKLNTTGSWSSVTVLNTPTLLLEFLQQSSDYDVRVKSKCDSTTYSIYSSVEHFSTLSNPCLTPSGLTFITQFDQFESIYWTPGGNETSWQVELNRQYAPEWDTSIVVNTNPYLHLHEFIQPYTQFKARVKALCNPGESDYTTTIPFMTGSGVIYHTVTATSSGPGTISPNGEIELYEGGIVNIVFTPDPNGVVTAIKVDTVTYTGSFSSYSFTFVDEDHSIHVFFGTVGVDEHDSESVSLYPNPAQTTIELYLESEKLQENECQLFDVYGKLLHTIPIQADHTTLDILDLSSGIYFIRIRSEKGITTKKFIKN
jgi:hypothetical protein